MKKIIPATFSKITPTLIFIALFAVLFSGCSILNPLEVKPVEDNVKSQTTLYGSTAAVRNIMVRNRKNSRIICAEPMPDVSFDEEEEGDWDFSFISIGGDEKGQEEAANIEAGLGGRNPNVLITREILFRYCEFISNVELSDKDKAKMFKDVLDSIVKINKVNLGVGTQAEAESTMIIQGKQNPPEEKDPEDPEGGDDPQD